MSTPPPKASTHLSPQRVLRSKRLEASQQPPSPTSPIRKGKQATKPTKKKVQGQLVMNGRGPPKLKDSSTVVPLPLPHDRSTPACDNDDRRTTSMGTLTEDVDPNRPSPLPRTAFPDHEQEVVEEDVGNQVAPHGEEDEVLPVRSQGEGAQPSKKQVPVVKRTPHGRQSSVMSEDEEELEEEPRGNGFAARLEKARGRSTPSIRRNQDARQRPRPNQRQRGETLSHKGRGNSAGHSASSRRIQSGRGDITGEPHARDTMGSTPNARAAKDVHPRQDSIAESQPSQRAEASPRTSQGSTTVRSLRNELDQLNEKVDYVLELLTTRTGIGSGVVRKEDAPNGKRDVRGRTPKTLFRELMADRHPYMDVAFGNLPRCRTLLHCVMAEIVDPERMSYTAKGMRDAIASIMFSLRVDESKDKLKVGFGPKAIAFHKRLMNVSLTNAVNDTFGLFAKVPEPETNGRPAMPPWLYRKSGKESYVSVAHINETLHKYVSGTDSKKEQSRRKDILSGSRPTRRDDGVFITGSMHSLFMETLNESRKKGPPEFFVMVGYLFDKWDTLSDIDLRSSSVEMKWVDDEGDVHKGLDSCPEAIRISECNPDMDKINEERYEKFVHSVPGLVLQVGHFVKVRSKGKRTNVRKHKGNMKRWYCRNIHLMDVALYFICSFSGFEKTDNIHVILGYHRRSIAAIFMLAHAFRRVIGRKVDRSPEPIDRDVQANNNGADGHPPTADQDGDILDEIFKFLIPAPAIRQDKLEEAVCSVPEEVYHAEHIEERNVDEEEKESEDEDVAENDVEQLMVVEDM